MKAATNNNRRSVSFWIFLIVVLISVVGMVFWYWQQVRQQRLDHALIEAIKKEDTKTAIALLDAGADANATDKPYKPMTWNRMLADLWNKLQGKKPAIETQVYESALVLVYPTGRILTRWGYGQKQKEFPDLVKALLKHGA